MSSTPLRSGYSVPVYADPAATMSGGTPLIVAIFKGRMSDEYHVTVKLQLLQAYERAIFELQQQLTHYKSLVDVLVPKPEPEELRLETALLNPASVRLLDSIAHARIAPSAVRSLEEDERH